MSTPKGMKCSNRRLVNGDRVLIYSDQERIVFQIRHQTPTEENLLDPSFKVAVTLSPADALLVASELLAAAVPRLTTAEQPTAMNGEDHHDVS
jgi:hypothetical protein